MAAGPRGHPGSLHRMSRRAHLLPRAAAALAVVAVAGCGSGGTEAPASTSSGTATSATSSDGSASSSDTSDETTSSTSGSSGADGASACVARVRDAMSPTQQAGQLLMVAMSPGPATSLDPQINGQGVGSMLYLGGWQGASTVRAASEHLQQVSPTIDGTKVGMLVAADQEGGEVQQLTGAGFSSIPSGLEQAQLPDLRSSAKGWGDELRDAGVNVNLAPVADTVPDSVGRSNAPIGRFAREYGSTPKAAGQGSLAFARGMRDAGVEPIVKHFPGIGRIIGNTDLTDRDITDTEMTTKDAYLAPFARTIDEGGTKIVMIGSARYSKIDGQTPALFSEKIITGMLRTDLGFDGVVVTDDVGAAKAVSATPVGERATKFVAAGGDIVLTADPTQVGTMVSELESAATQDRTFSKQVEASVSRVLALKEEMGLLRCG